MVVHLTVLCCRRRGRLCLGVWAPLCALFLCVALSPLSVERREELTVDCHLSFSFYQEGGHPYQQPQPQGRLRAPPRPSVVAGGHVPCPETPPLETLCGLGQAAVLLKLQHWRPVFTGKRRLCCACCRPRPQPVTGRPGRAAKAWWWGGLLSAAARPFAAKIKQVASGFRGWAALAAFPPAVLTQPRERRPPGGPARPLKLTDAGSLRGLHRVRGAAGRGGRLVLAS